MDVPLLCICKTAKSFQRICQKFITIRRFLSKKMKKVLDAFKRTMELSLQKTKKRVKCWQLDTIGIIRCMVLWMSERYAYILNNTEKWWNRRRNINGKK